MEQVMLDMIPTGAKAVCHVSQYDIGRTIRFNLRSGGAAYTLSGTETVKVYIKKPDGTTAERNIANTSSTYVDWVTGEGDCDQAGKCECELVITSGTTVIGSKNFTVKIEEDPYNDQGVVTETAGPAVIATFTTNVVDLLQEVKCSINPIQDLHGYDHPWPAGGGKNKLETTLTSQTLRGVIFTVNADGTFTANGTATDGYSQVTVGTISLPAGDYVISDEGNFERNNDIELYINGMQSASTKYSDNRSFTLTSPITNAIVYFFIGNGKSINTTIKPMIRPASISEPTFEPYANICPIIGIDELNISRTGANLLGGLRLAETFSSCFGYTLDTTEKTFTFSRTWATRAPYYRPLITGIFKPDTVYTLMGYYKANAENQCLKVQYTDNTNQRFAIPASNSKVAFAFSTRSDKTVESIGVDWYADGLVTLYYDECGLFEGVKTIDELNPYSGKLIKLEFDDTVYLAEVSCSNGVWKLKLLGAEVDLGDLNWTHRTDVSQGVFAAQLPDYKFSSDVYAICENYEFRGTAVSSTIVSHGNDCILLYFDNQQTARYVYVYDTAYSDANTFKTAMDGVKFVYELATPIEITLDETEQFEALLGVNNVWHDGNGDTEVKYLYNA